MTSTYRSLQTYMDDENSKPYTFRPGRPTSYEIPDMFTKGILAYLALEPTAGEAGMDVESDEDGVAEAGLDFAERELDPTLDDLSMELDF